MLKIQNKLKCNVEDPRAAAISVDTLNASNCTKRVCKPLHNMPPPPERFVFSIYVNATWAAATNKPPWQSNTLANKKSQSAKAKVKHLSAASKQVTATYACNIFMCASRANYRGEDSDVGGGVERVAHSKTQWAITPRREAVECAQTNA